MRTSARRVLAGTAAVAAIGAAAITQGSPAGAVRPIAGAILHDASGVQVGEVVFKGHGRHAERVLVSLDAPSAPGKGDFHGLHIHTTGTCIAPAFTSAGGHWNPTGADHGHHTGDLPSILLNGDGTAYLEFETARFDVNDLFGGDGSAVVLHVGRDNFANIPASPYGGPVGATLATGDAGGRYACGVVTNWQSYQISP